MRERHEFVDYVIELLGPFGTVSAKRMFGGHGIYLDGLMIAIVAREGLWLKADEINRHEFENANCELFTYSRGGAAQTLGFYRAPAESLESSQEMLPWARSAYAAALRANAKRVAAENARAARLAAAPARPPQHPRTKRAASRPGGKRAAKPATTRAKGQPASATRARATRSAGPTRHRRGGTKR